MKDSPRTRHKPIVTKSCRRFTAVETDQSQPELRQDVQHLQENENADEHQFQEVWTRCGPSVAHASGSSLDKVAPL